MSFKLTVVFSCNFHVAIRRSGAHSDNDDTNVIGYNLMSRRQNRGSCLRINSYNERSITVNVTVPTSELVSRYLCFVKCRAVTTKNLPHVTSYAECDGALVRSENILMFLTPQEVMLKSIRQRP